MNAGSAKAKQAGMLSAIERLAWIHLGNRFIWLAAGLAWYMIGQLSFVQWRSAVRLAEGLQFDTLELMAHLTAAIEAGLLATALILALSTGRTREAWRRRFPGQPFSYIASCLASTLVLLPVAGILLLPVIVLHRYPELAAEGVSIPLMMLQRVLLLVLAVLITYNVVTILRLPLGLPRWLSAMLGLAFHIGLGYYVTFLSFTTEAYARLNDVFYYNQLWRYMEGFPNLQRPQVFHNIEMPYYAYFAAAGAVLWMFTLLLWLPKAGMLGSAALRGGVHNSGRDARPTRKKSSQ
ncbi:hypothetical protein IIA79_07500 [bacterium]|nr:hypothetical protein [bacterium]